MRFRTVLALIVVVATAAFLIANWHVFAATASFNFVLGSVDIPVGTVMAIVVALAILVMAILTSIWQGSLLRDYRQQSKELQVQRQLAADAEASRFTALSTLLREEIGKLNTRFDTAITELTGELRDTEHSIAATLAEMDDRILRATNSN
jgi:hypothetical protein